MTSKDIKIELKQEINTLIYLNNYLLSAQSGPMYPGKQWHFPKWQFPWSWHALGHVKGISPRRNSDNYKHCNFI